MFILEYDTLTEFTGTKLAKVYTMRNISRECALMMRIVV